METKTILPRLSNEESFWTDAFEVTNDDLDYLFNLFLETETPLSLRDLTLKLIAYRLNQEERRIAQQIKRGQLFQPRAHYEIGQEIVFPTRDYEVGEVVATRPGNNPEYGEFAVIKVRFEDGRTVEFASDLLTPHVLNVDVEQIGDDTVDPMLILRRYGRHIAHKLKDRFDEEEDVVYLAGRWFLKSLLADVNIAHLHLSEAVLDMHGGGPLDTEAILQEIGMEFDANERLQVFSMDYALQQDDRFDEVGPAGRVIWYLRQLEPDAVRQVPPQLRYEPIPYELGPLSDDMQELIIELDDELSPIELPDYEEDSATITLTYPYRRTGTLPLAASMQHLFPTAFETNRIMTTLIDSQTDEEVQGWVVREQGYVYGLEKFYRQYQIPIGAYVTVRRHEDPAKLIIDFANHRPRTEWIRLAIPEESLLRFENHKRSIGAAYDDLMIFGVEDIAAFDALWVRCQTMSIETIVKRLVPELTRLTPQQAVHFKTLYSAVNLVKRCPPEPILAILVGHPNFELVGGAYWRMA
ncbi:MAG: hypothetical protein GYB66_04600 [Chloroflexi bacterium]|nr:hypothetical protein [Chloroflexota bacterium]